MSASENKLSKGYLYASLILILFGMIYEHFSYSVYSPFMAYAFLFPFVGGYLYIKVRRAKKLPVASEFSNCLHTAGISFLTMGSIFKGILDIYGTTNRLGIVYWIVGLVFLALSLFRKGLFDLVTLKPDC